jgi:small conductance mechanosensitive channel
VTPTGDLVWALLLSLLTALVAYALLYGLERMLGLSSQAAPRHSTRFLRVARFYLPIVRAGVWLVAALVVVSILLRRESTWTTLLAVLPLALGAGLALRDYFADVFAGIRLALERPFKRGDRIEFGGMSGTVIVLSLTQTRVRTDDGQERHLPNRRLLVEGYRTIRRVERDVPVDVELPLGERRDFDVAKEAAYRAAIVSRYVSPTETPEVYLEFGDQGVRLRVRAYVAASDLIDAFRSELVELWLERGRAEGQGDRLR